MSHHFAAKSLARVSLLLAVAALAGCGTGPADSKSDGGPASTETAAAGTPEAQTREGVNSKPETPGSQTADPGTADLARAAEPSSAPADGTTGSLAKGGILSAAELAKVLDLRQLPVFKGAKFHARTAAEVGAEVPARIPAIVDFYLKAFAAIGFKPTADSGSPIIADDFAQAELARDGFVAHLTVMNGSEPGTMTVILTRQGEFDCSRLPVNKGATALGPTTGHAMWVAQGSVAEESEWVAKALAGQGWQQFEVPYKALPDTSDSRRFQFRNQGYVVSVSVNKPPVPNSKTAVQYQMSTIAHELPAPPDARDLVFHDATQVLKCQAPGDVVDAEKFYRDALPRIGFKALQHDDPEPDHIVLRFEPPEKGIMLVDLTTDDHKTTRINLTWHPRELPLETDASEK